MKETLVKAYHWLLVAIGLSGIASALAAPSPGAASPSSPMPPSRPTRGLLDAKGLRRRLEEEPELADAIFEFAASKGWGEDQLDYFVAVVGNIESGWDPKAVNPYTQATGLIQFMPSTARALGTSIEELSAMSAKEQMSFVAKFFSPYKSLAARDVYPAIFYPAVIGKSDETVIFTSPSKGYEQNRGLDVNKDGTITAGDVRRAADNAVFSLRQKPRIMA